MKFQQHNIPKIGKIYKARYPFNSCKARVDRIGRSSGEFEFICTIFITKELKKLGFRAPYKETLFLQDFKDFSNDVELF